MSGPEAVPAVSGSLEAGPQVPVETVVGSSTSRGGGREVGHPTETAPTRSRSLASGRGPPTGATSTAVESANLGKNRRLKQAKEEAQAEIEQYRLQREKEFKAKEAAALGSHGSCSSEVEKETREKMTVLQNYFEQNRDEVLDNLLAFVCDIRPEIHENYRING